jgi:EmrB/QacA subfamily drug resistance transporter
MRAATRTETVESHAGPRVSDVYRRRWWTLGVLSLVLVVIGMDNLIVNVALPTLVRDLGASGNQLQWIVDAYMLVFAGLLLSMGSLGDRFGRKRALTAGLVVFVAGSVAAAFAGSAEVLIATRALMGVGAALIMPSTLSIITNTFPSDERGRAIGVWAGVAALGIILGPVVGGWLLDRYWWGSVFLVNVPIVAVALVAAWPLVPESRDPNATPLDPAGALLSITALVALVYGIIEAPTNGWGDPVTLSMFGAAALLLTLFVAWERRSPHPMVNMAFFANPRFSAASVTLALASFAMVGTLFVLTQHLQFVLGYTPLQAGVRMLPALSLMVSAPLSALAVQRLGTKAVVVAGMLIVAVGLWLFSTATVADGYGPVGWSLVVFGIGMGLTLAPATDAIMGSLPLAKAGVGSAMNDTTRLVGGALGVAVFGTVMSSAYASRIAPALSGLPAPGAAAARDSVGAATIIAARLGPAGSALAAAARSASASAMGTAVAAGIGVVILGALVALLFLPSRPLEAIDERATIPDPESELAAVGKSSGSPVVRGDGTLR